MFQHFNNNNSYASKASDSVPYRWPGPAFWPHFDTLLLTSQHYKKIKISENTKECQNNHSLEIIFIYPYKVPPSGQSEFPCIIYLVSTIQVNLLSEHRSWIGMPIIISEFTLFKTDGVTLTLIRLLQSTTHFLRTFRKHKNEKDIDQGKS